MVSSQRSYVWYLKSYTNGVIPTYEVVSIKNARFKCQPSTPMQPFVSRDAHLLWKLMTKGERLRQRYYNWGFGHGRWTWKMDKEGATLKNGEGSKFLDKEKHTSRGSKLMNLIVCI